MPNPGLKKMVEQAMNMIDAPPVTVSTEARRALTEKVREWSGWPDASLIIGVPDPKVSPFASCDHTTRTFIFNVDDLALNPNRVLLTVTPFRLKQEAVLTGTMLHEAGHARYSLWRPTTVAEAQAWVHVDGKEITPQEVALAKLMEEPRIEGLVARDSGTIGATGLDWTMRAMAAHLMPVTALSMDPNLKIMQLIESWALRAGRQIALTHHVQHPQPMWVVRFTTLLRDTLVRHVEAVSGPDIGQRGIQALDLLLEMVKWDGTTGLFPITHARQVLELLFPETEDDEKPEAGGGCAMPMPQDEDQTEEPDEDEEGDTAPAAETDDEETDEGEDQSEGDEPGDGDADPEEDGSEDGEPDDGATDSTDEIDSDSDLARQLRAMEETADDAVEEEVDDKADPAGAAGGDTPVKDALGFRKPNPRERETQKGAERLLRRLIAPSETSRVALSDSPSAAVDPAALSAWRAGGQRTAPNFFRRTHREVMPCPPVKIAVLVDVSYSMSPLQHPSALLSWALASAALDLRNFAGRGQQIESTLIHWGNRARVVQANGKPLPGIKTVGCNEFTTAMGDALDLVEQEIPGFFDGSEKPENRLLVQFTDWELDAYRMQDIQSYISRALAAGVNMLTVAPVEYNKNGDSVLPALLKKAPVHRGAAPVLKFNPSNPDEVWRTALAALTK